MKVSEIIADIIDNDLECVMAGVGENDNWWFENIMTGGVVGYHNQTLPEILQEYEERFGVPANENGDLVNDLNLSGGDKK